MCLECVSFCAYLEGWRGLRYRLWLQRRWWARAQFQGTILTNPAVHRLVPVPKQIEHSFLEEISWTHKLVSPASCDFLIINWAPNAPSPSVPLYLSPRMASSAYSHTFPFSQALKFHLVISCSRQIFVHCIETVISVQKNFLPFHLKISSPLTQQEAASTCVDDCSPFQGNMLHWLKNFFLFNCPLPFTFAWRCAIWIRTLSLQVTEST